MNSQCTILDRIVIEKSSISAFSSLARWHYRSASLGPYTAIYAARDIRTDAVAAVIVYAMPQIGSAIRARAMAALNAVQYPPNADLSDRIRWLNENLRCISRVIVDPRYRGIGLAARLVRNTLPLAGVPIVEAVAAMGNFHPFFEKAGMTRFDPPPCRTRIRLENALRAVGISPSLFIDSVAVHNCIDSLSGSARLFIEAEMRLFLRPFVKRRDMTHSLERTRFILSRLGPAPAYYLWLRNDCPDSNPHESFIRAAQS